MKIKANLLKYKDPNTGSYSPIPVVVSGEDIANKQDKVDNTLNTTDKTIVGSINELSDEIGNYLPKNQGASNVGKILVVGSDGNLTLTDMPQGGVSGDVVGTLDESNNLLLSGNLANGTYTLKWLNSDGTYSDAGTMEVGEIEDPEEPESTNLFVIGGDGYITDGRCSSTGEDRTGNTGYIVTNYIDIKNGDTVYIKNATVSKGTTGHSGIKLTDGTTIGLYPDSSEYITNYSESNGITQFTINKADADYIRITLEIYTDGRQATEERVSEMGIIITVSEPAYINLAEPNAVNTTDFTIWCNDARMTSGTGGVYEQKAGVVTTNYFKASVGDVIRVKGLSAVMVGYPLVGLFNSSKTVLAQGVNNLNTMQTNGYISNVNINGDLLEFKLAYGDISYVRLSSTLTSNINDVIITVNEEITSDTPSEPTYTNFADPTSSDWVAGRISNSATNGVATDASTTRVTNFIPVENGDVIVVGNCETADVNISVGGTRFAVYSGTTHSTRLYNGIYDSTNGYMHSTGDNEFTIVNSSVKYVRFTIGDFTDENAVTINIQRNGEWL